jgi:hypothetical protein
VRDAIEYYVHYYVTPFPVAQVWTTHSIFWAIYISPTAAKEESCIFFMRPVRVFSSFREIQQMLGKAKQNTAVESMKQATSESSHSTQPKTPIQPYSLNTPTKPFNKAPNSNLTHPSRPPKLPKIPDTTARLNNNSPLDRNPKPHTNFSGPPKYPNTDHRATETSKYGTTAGRTDKIQKHSNVAPKNYTNTANKSQVASNFGSFAERKHSNAAAKHYPNTANRSQVASKFGSYAEGKHSNAAAKHYPNTANRSPVASKFGSSAERSDTTRQHNMAARSYAKNNSPTESSAESKNHKHSSMSANNSGKLRDRLKLERAKKKAADIKRAYPQKKNDQKVLSIHLTEGIRVANLSSLLQINYRNL